MRKGRPVVGRIEGKDGRYITYLYSDPEGKVLESSKEFTEDQTRVFLANNYGLSSKEIEALMARANIFPGI